MKTPTTIKIETSQYDELKILGIRHKHSLQKIVEKAIYRYVNDETFRNDINCFNLPVPPPDPKEVWVYKNKKCFTKVNTIYGYEETTNSTYGKYFGLAVQNNFRLL